MRELIERRADGRCEYCKAPQDVCAYTFHLEHIIPSARGGGSDESNIALACAACNLAKAANTEAVDPLHRGSVPLFHPREHAWDDHFNWNSETCEIEGRTAIGRATIRLLQLNASRRLAARRFWKQVERWP